MRVLLVCPSWGRECGVADYTRYLAEGFAAIGVEAPVVAGAGEVGHALSTSRFDVVHLQHEYTLFEHVLPAVLGQVAGRAPIIATMHTITNSPGPAQQHPMLAGHCRGIIVHSEDARHTLIAGGVPAHLLTVTNQGCPNFLHTFGDQTQVRAEMGIPPEAFAVGFFGFAFPNKGIVPLVQAIQQTGVWGFIQASDHWLVPGYYDQVCRELGFPLGHDRLIAHQVILSRRHLPSDLVGRYMHAMDILILPYWAAPGVASTSAAVRTALAMNRAVVTTQVTSFSDLTEQVQKIPDQSVAHIRTAIELFRNNVGLRNVFAENARRYALRNRWEIVARRHIEIYRRRQAFPIIPGWLVPTYNGHPDSIYDIPIQRERVNWIWENVTGRMVELGCANGYITEQCGGALGVDTNLHRLAVAQHLRRGCNFEQRDITQPLPYSDNAFDTVLLPEVIQGIPYQSVPRALQEAVRIGRRLVITVPNGAKPNYDPTLVENPEHKWLGTPENIHELLSTLSEHDAPGAEINVTTSPGHDFVYATLQRS